MTAEELVRRHPVVWHLATEDAWPAIRRRGLLSVARLLQEHGHEANEVERLTRRRRDAAVVLEHDVHGTAVLRDQLPINEKTLVRLLSGIRPADYYALLNERVFFFADRRGIDTLRAAKLNRSQAHDLLHVDTAALLAAHSARVEWCSLNSGAAFPRTTSPRGRDVFRALGPEPAGGRRARVAEVTVLGGVPDIADLVVDVTRLDALQR